MEEENHEVEFVDEPVIVEKPVKEKKPKPQTSDFIRAESGDSYLSIAIRHCPDENPNKCARDLFALNNGAIVRAGSKIFLKEIR
jgi:hypothetical protein